MANTERLERIVKKSTQAEIESRKARRVSIGQRKYNIHVAMRLLQYIEDNPGMNQKRLAKLLEISPAFLSRVVNGKENLSLNIVEEYEQRLDGYPLLHDKEPQKNEIKTFAEDSYCTSSDIISSICFKTLNYGTDCVFA